MAAASGSPDDERRSLQADLDSGGGDRLYLAAVVFSDRSMGYSCSTATPPGAGLDSRRSPPVAVRPAVTAACQLAAAMDSDSPLPNGVRPGRVTDNG